MSRKTLLAGGIITASVFAGGVGGALLFTPQLSSAQVSTASPVGAPWAMARGAGGPEVLATAATALGMSQADLKTALQGGKTIAEVAKDKGVDVQKVIDALVAEAKDRIEADLPARMTDLVNGKLGFRAGGERGGRPDRGADLGAAATALGMSEADLQTALRGGKTMAQVAKDKGVDVQKVIDALVAEAKDRIEADLPARMTDLVNGKLGLRAGGDHGARPAMGADLGAAATALGMSEADLKTALRDGTTLAQVAKDKGVDVQKVIDAVVAAQSAQLDQAVTDGKLTQAQATARKAGLKDRVTALVNGARPAGGPDFRHRGRR